MIAKPTSTTTMEAAIVLEALFPLFLAGGVAVEDPDDGRPPAKIRQIYMHYILMYCLNLL